MSTAGTSLSALQNSSLNCRREQALPPKESGVPRQRAWRAVSWEVKFCPHPPGGPPGLSCQWGLPSRVFSSWALQVPLCPQGLRLWFPRKVGSMAGGVSGGLSGPAPAGLMSGWERAQGVGPLGYLMTPRRLEDNLLGTACFHRGSYNPGPGQSWDLSRGLPGFRSRQLGRVRRKVGTTAVSTPLSSSSSAGQRTSTSG